MVQFDVSGAMGVNARDGVDGGIGMGGTDAGESGDGEMGGSIDVTLSALGDGARLTGHLIMKGMERVIDEVIDVESVKLVARGGVGGKGGRGGNGGKGRSGAKGRNARLNQVGENGENGGDGGDGAQGTCGGRGGNGGSIVVRVSEYDLYLLELLDMAVEEGAGGAAGANGKAGSGGPGGAGGACHVHKQTPAKVLIANPDQVSYNDLSVKYQSYSLKHRVEMAIDQGNLLLDEQDIGAMMKEQAFDRYTAERLLTTAINKGNVTTDRGTLRAIEGAYSVEDDGRRMSQLATQKGNANRTIMIPHQPDDIEIKTPGGRAGNRGRDGRVHMARCATGCDGNEGNAEIIVVFRDGSQGSFLSRFVLDWGTKFALSSATHGTQLMEPGDVVQVYGVSVSCRAACTPCPPLSVSLTGGRDDAVEPEVSSSALSGNASGVVTDHPLSFRVRIPSDNLSSVPRLINSEIVLKSAFTAAAHVPVHRLNEAGLVIPLQITDPAIIREFKYVKSTVVNRTVKLVITVANVGAVALGLMSDSRRRLALRLIAVNSVHDAPYTIRIKDPSGCITVLKPGQQLEPSLDLLAPMGTISSSVFAIELIADELPQYAKIPVLHCDLILASPGRETTERILQRMPMNLLVVMDYEPPIDSSVSLIITNDSVSQKEFSNWRSLFVRNNMTFSVYDVTHYNGRIDLVALIRAHAHGTIVMLNQRHTNGTRTSKLINLACDVVPCLQKHPFATLLVEDIDQALDTDELRSAGLSHSDGRLLVLSSLAERPAAFALALPLAKRILLLQAGNLEHSDLIRLELVQEIMRAIRDTTLTEQTTAHLIDVLNRTRSQELLADLLAISDYAFSFWQHHVSRRSMRRRLYAALRCAQEERQPDKDRRIKLHADLKSNRKGGSRKASVLLWCRMSSRVSSVYDARCGDLPPSYTPVLHSWAHGGRDDTPGNPYADKDVISEAGMTQPAPYVG